MTKTLKHLLEDAQQEHQTLIDILPDIASRLNEQMRNHLGLDGILITDLRQTLVSEQKHYSTSQLQRALKELGWESFSTIIPGRTKRVRVWAKKDQKGKFRRPESHSDDPEERQMAKLLSRYTDPTSPDYDQKLKDWVEVHCPIPEDGV